MAREDEELADVEHLIGQIQSLMSNTVDSKGVSFRQKSQKPKKKHDWQKKGVSSFPRKSDGVSKLEEMLLNYHHSDVKSIV